MNRLSLVAVVVTVVFNLPVATAPAAGKISDAPEFSQAYKQQRDDLAARNLDVLILELRGTVERLAGRGSQVHAPSTRRRVEGFERVLLRGLQEVRCQRKVDPKRLVAEVAEHVMSAGNGNGIKVDAYDCGQLTACAVLVLEKASAKKLCESKSLNGLLE